MIKSINSPGSCCGLTCLTEREQRVIAHIAKRLFGKGLRRGGGRDSSLGWWTPESRGRMAEISKKTKRYPSDLTDEEWERIAPLMPKPGRRERPREVESPP